MGSHTERDVDLVYGRVLPYLHETPANDVAMVQDFTRAESQNLRLPGLPVLINHNDGTEEKRPLDLVGKVMSADISGVHCNVLMAVNPDGSHANRYASNAVANGEYGGISLQNTVESRASADTGRNILLKKPLEVSLCKTGLRHGSFIRDFMPSRKTCERLLRDGHEHIETMTRRFGYDKGLRDRKLTPSDKEKYIDALMLLVEERVAKHSQPKKTPLRVRASMSANDQQQQQQKQEQPPAEQEQKEEEPGQGEGNAGKPDAMEVDSASSAEGAAPAGQVPNVRDAKVMAAEALRSREEVVELKRQLAESRKAQEELNAIKAQEREKQRKQFQTIVRSYVQNAEKANMDKEQIENTVKTVEEMYNDKPESALGLIESSLAMSVRASQSYESAQHAQAQRLAEHAKAQDDAYYDRTATRMAQLREEERSFSLSQPMPAGTKVSLASLSQQDVGFLASQYRPPQQAESSSFEKRYMNAGRAQAPPPQQQQQQQQQFSAPSRSMEIDEKAPGPLFVRASEANEKNTYDAAQQFKQQLNLLGRLPTYGEVSVGISVEHTGKMKASATGGPDVPETRIAPLRRQPAAVEPANFAPQWNEVLERALRERSDNGVRYLGGDRIKQTHVGSGYDI